MPTFYFHLHNNVDARDEEGREFPSLEAACAVAYHNARFTFAQTIMDEGRGNLDHRIDIENEDRQVLATVRFRDVVTIEGT